MTGVAIRVEINDREVQDLLKQILKRTGDLTPAMNIIGETVKTSVIRNFEKSGRPVRWKALSEVTLKRRRGGKILMREGLAGGLAGSIHAKAFKDRVLVGTDKIYGAVHQFGAEKGEFGTVSAEVREHVRVLRSGKEVKVRSHTRRQLVPWGDIPARPYLMVQEEDCPEIRAELTDYLLSGETR